MKTLYIVRHAKSSWDDPLQDDFDRPLNDRGNRDAPRMAKRLREKNIYPDIMLSSPAKRAFSTCKRMAEILNYPEKKIETSRKLYHAGEQQILEVIRKVNDKHKVIMLFGHNPGLTDFSNEFLENGKYVIDNLPTCGIFAFSIPRDSWSNVCMGDGQFIFFDFPKSKED